MLCQVSDVQQHDSVLFRHLNRRNDLHVSSPRRVVLIFWREILAVPRTIVRLTSSRLLAASPRWRASPAECGGPWSAAAGSGQSSGSGSVFFPPEGQRERGLKPSPAFLPTRALSSSGSGPAPLSLPAEGYFQKPGKKGAEKSCSDSGSDCGSSSGSVRASRGSWGSWSSASSSDGDRKPAVGPPRCLLPGKSAAAPGAFPAPRRARPGTEGCASSVCFALLLF